MKQKNIFIAASVLLIAAFAVGAFFYKNQQTQQAEKLAAQNQAALVRADSPSFGNADAPVHIVEFFDPACGTCREFYPLVKNLMAAHPGKIRLSMRYAPFHPGSDQVVKVMEAAFASQAVWVQNHTAQLALIWSPLASLGLDMERIKSDMNSPEIARTIEQDLADAKTMNVTMTPEYFVNGRPLPSFGFEQLKALVDEALVNTNTK
jgi:protein-disulfide isomerase